MMIASLVLGVVVLVIVFAMGGSSSSAASNEAERPAQPARTGGKKPAATPSSGARTGSVPDRPAPAVDDAVLDAADELYRKAATQWNEAQDARGDGRTADYQRLLLESWDTLGLLYDSIETQTDWLEEADLDGWAVPAEYARLQSELERWDSLRIKVKKLKPARRRD